MRNILKFLTAIICIYTPDLFCADIAPTAHHVVLSVSMDKASLPDEVKIFDNIFGGQTTRPDGGDDSGYVRWHKNNTLTCLSRTDTANGACPTNPYWGNGFPGQGTIFDGEIVLRFTQENTGKTVDLTLNGIRTKSTSVAASLWNATGNRPRHPVTFFLAIPRAGLAKLSAGAQPWKAKLKMNLTQWSYNCEPPARHTASRGCPGTALMLWTADITLKITDLGTQQIYLPEYGSGKPVVDMGLKVSKFGTPNASASASRTVDMCLYDGSNSSASQISMLFTDDGKTAPGRPEGYFSVYTGSGSDLTHRLDYRLSVINPVTGSPQAVNNGTEIVWTGVSAEAGKVKTRLVSLPGVSGMVQCVPAPVTLNVPEFKISSKSPGRYTGVLRVIYTPTTQSFSDNTSG